ncbi:flagellar biosynthesis protein flio [Lucifera butyrica]|uniref:Flagellar protein n=1 Tax=Lucifera butyrica TaxID=1351585 RepID=A0A498RDD8_9FIRM|nr:flagellar biosynthesis protein flio [Lucifera butyrica]
MPKRYIFLVLLLLCLLTLLVSGQVAAAEQSAGYLQYHEPQPAAPSLWSTVSYLFSLLLTFALVLGLAYYTSRFMGKKMGNVAGHGPLKVLAALSLGTSRAVYIIEAAGKFLVIGVTDHGISVLNEITAGEEIEKLKANHSVIPANQFENMFQRQLASLQQMSRKFPHVFGLQDEKGQVNEQKER